MTQSVLERTGEHIAGTVDKAARATAAIGDALYERYDEAKVLARRGARHAEELLDEGRAHIKRHPASSVAGTFLLGLGVGILVGWSLRRR